MNRLLFVIFASMAGIYIHIPFCKSKCLYCGFFSKAGKNNLFQVYVDRLIEEIETRCEEIVEPVNTIYYGGGTPSLLPCRDFRRLSDALPDIFGRMFHPIETTIEVNPEDVTLANAESWKSAGVNRVSMGCQSFVDKELRSVGRRHDREDIFSAYNILRPLFDNISLDLICGLPGQTMDSWKASINSILSMRPEHISVYSLECDCDSALAGLIKNDRIAVPGEEEVVSLFAYARNQLIMEGYEHYEISNFALPGHRSRHNSSYWHGIPYLGFGPAAASFNGKDERRVNDADIHGYLSSEGDVPHSVEHLSQEQKRLEYLLTHIRLAEGIDLNEYKMLFDMDETRKLLERAERFLVSGDLLHRNNCLSLSDYGISLEDFILSSLA